jgi:hypothetical protein
VLLQAALEYQSKGFAPIPVDLDKKPLIAWKSYQEKQPTKEEVEKWFNECDCKGIALLTGKTYGFIVFDVERAGLGGIEGLEFPKTTVAISGGSGKHFYFAYPPDVRIGNYARVMPDCDIRGDGGYIIVCPSLHKSGNQYQWETPLDKGNLNTPPSWLFDLLNKKKIPFDINRTTKQGERNSVAAQAAGTFLVKYQDQQYAREMLKKWNDKKCEPPLSEKELETIFTSILNRHMKQLHAENLLQSVDDVEAPMPNKASKSKVARAINLVMFECGDGFFIDQNNEVNVRIKIRDHYEVIACKSSDFKELVSSWFFKDEKEILKKEEVNHIIGIISCQAKEVNTKQIELHVRVANLEDKFYYDLANSEWDSVEVERDEWNIIKPATPIFRRYRHQKAQVTPANEENDIRLILKYINLKKQYQVLLFLVFLVSSFIPSIPHVIAIVYGPQGSAKTTFSKILKLIIDPSEILNFTFPKDEAELIQQLYHHWFVTYDNISYLHEWASNSLCRSVTGAGMSKRKLYTDDEDVYYSFQRVMLLNGINLASTKPDVMDRSIIFELDRISETERRTEKEIWGQFQEDLPKILGGIFDVLAKAKSYYSSVKLMKKPRMADFAEWGVAISTAMGYSQQEFENALLKNGAEQNDVILADDSVASAIIEFMKDKPTWEGTLTELFNSICIKENKKISNMPKGANSLSRRLNIVKSNLVNSGIVIENLKDTDGKRGRFIKIVSSICKEPSLQSLSSLEEKTSDDGDDRDDMSAQDLIGDDLG